MNILKRVRSYCIFMESFSTKPWFSSGTPEKLGFELSFETLHRQRQQ
jgi:hypothetical protein